MTPREKAQQGLTQIKDAVSEFLAAATEGRTHADICKALGLESDYEGKSNNYLSWSVLGLLIGEGRIRHIGSGQKRRYLLVRE